jgi:enoyl-CoA hydratase
MTTAYQDGADPHYSIDWLDGGAVFTIRRPQKLNALTKPVFEGLRLCLDRLERENQRFIIMTGAGDRAFSAGTDLAEAQGMSSQAWLDKNKNVRDLLYRLSRSPVLSIAAINGLALGGGLEVAMACTLRVAVPHAVLGLPEIKLNLLPSYGGTQFLPAIIGRARAEELMLTGRNVDTTEAHAIGLIHRTVPEGVVDASLALARDITQYAPNAIAAIRACIAAAGPGVTDAGLDVEDRWVREVFPSPEATAGLAAFLARRKS